MKQKIELLFDLNIVIYHHNNCSVIFYLLVLVFNTIGFKFNLMKYFVSYTTRDKEITPDLLKQFS